MNRSLLATAQGRINNDELSKDVANSLKMVMRSFDPCLTCATHSLNVENSLPIELYDSRGRLIDVLGGT